VCTRKHGIVANSNWCRTRQGLGGLEITSVGRHVRCYASIEEPLSGLRSKLWNIRGSQYGEQCLVVPNISGGGWWLDDARRELWWRNGKVSLLGWSTRMGTKDVAARDTERHRPCINHNIPWVETRCPACGTTGHRSRARTTQMLVTAMSMTSPMTLLVFVA
jgi:hypothetical protein